MSTVAESKAQSFMEEQFQDGDPTLAYGFNEVFNKEIIFKVDKQNVTYRTRILTLNDEQSVLSNVRFELFDDNDIGFYYESSFLKDDYQQFMKDNKLTIKFEGFANSVKTLLDNSVKNKNNYQCRFTISEDKEKATIKFFQKLRLRNVEIFGIEFHRSDKTFIETQAQFRFNKNKSELSQKKREYEEIINIIKEKNPHIAKKISQAVDEDIRKMQEREEE